MPQLFAMIESYKSTLMKENKPVSGLQPSFCYMLGQEKAHHNFTQYANKTMSDIAVECVPVSIRAGMSLQ